VWAISVVIGLFQAYSYAEIVGLFKNKSGGAAIYGSAAWLRYSKLIAPLSVWCNWYAWTPVLSLGCTIAAGYILNAIPPIPIFTAESAEVVAWLKNAANAAAIDGKSAEEVLGAHQFRDHRVDRRSSARFLFVEVHKCSIVS
jgi:amino acid transporter